MTCDTCKAQIAEGSRFCSICGAALQAHAPVVPASRTDTLLAEANLFRIRGQWPDAEKRCVDVLRLDSSHVGAHTLLGDIYRDQSKIDEARQWYQMALDLDPDNLSLNEKLRSVRAGPARSSPVPQLRRPVSGSFGTQNLLGLSPTNWFRVIWVFSGLFIISVVGVVFWMRTSPRTVAFIPGGTLKGVPAEVPDAVRFLPNGQPRTPGNSIAGTISTSTSPPNQTSQGNEQTSGAGGVNPRPAASSVTTPPGLVSVASKEEALRTQLSRLGVLPEGTSLGSVRVDGRGHAVTVELIQRAPFGFSEADLRASAARSGLAAAYCVFGAEVNYSKVTIETRLSLAGGQPQPFFEGDVDRTSALRSDSSLRDEDRFTNTWWAAARPPEPALQP